MISRDQPVGEKRKTMATVHWPCQLYLAARKAATVATTRNPQSNSPSFKPPASPPVCPCSPPKIVPFCRPKCAMMMMMRHNSPASSLMKQVPMSGSVGRSVIAQASSGNNPHCRLPDNCSNQVDNFFVSLAGQPAGLACKLPHNRQAVCQTKLIPSGQQAHVNSATEFTHKHTHSHSHWLAR